MNWRKIETMVRSKIATYTIDEKLTVICNFISENPNRYFCTKCGSVGNTFVKDLTNPYGIYCRNCGIKISYYSAEAPLEINAYLNYLIDSSNEYLNSILNKAIFNIMYYQLENV